MTARIVGGALHANQKLRGFEPNRTACTSHFVKGILEIQELIGC